MVSVYYWQTTQNWDGPSNHQSRVVRWVTQDFAFSTALHWYSYLSNASSSDLIQNLHHVHAHVLARILPSLRPSPQWSLCSAIVAPVSHPAPWASLRVTRSSPPRRVPLSQCHGWVENFTYWCLGIIKSPRSGVTLCFQFVSAALASAAAKTFPSHVKTIWAKPLIFGTKNIWVWGNVMDDLSMTLTQGHSCGVDKQKFACLRDEVRTTHQITTKRDSFVMILPD